MVIRSLTVNNLKRLKDVSVRFGPGMVIVKGPNEAGKSTLQWALLLALFGDSHSRAAAVTQGRTWRQDDLFRIELEFDWNGHAYKLERDFENKTDRLVDVCTGEETSDKDVIASKLAEILGIGTEELFRSTACVTQNNVAAISSKGKQQVSQQLQSIITGGGEDTAATQAAALLASQVANLRRGLDRPASNPGAIKDTQDAISHLRQQLASKKSEADRIAEAGTVVRDSERDLKDKAERVEAVRTMLANCERRASLCEQLNSASEAEDAAQKEIESAERLRADIREKKKALEGFRGFAEMPPDTPQELATLEATLRVHVSAEKTAEEDFEKASVGAGAAQSAARHLPLIGGVVALLIAVVLMILGQYIGSVLSIAVGAGLFLIFQSRRSVDRDAIRQLEEAEERLDRIRSQIQLAYDEQQSLVKSSGCNSSDDLRRQWSEWSQLKLETAKLEAEIAGKLNGKSVDRLDEERRLHSRRRRDAEEQLETSEMAACELHPLERQQISLEAQRLEKEIAELERARTSAGALIDAIQMDPSEIYALEESLSAEQSRLDRAERLARVYTIAAEGIRDAVGQTLKGVRPMLEEQTGRYLSLITGGKYRKVVVDEVNLDFQIVSDEKTDKVDADGSELSRGALDQFYLAARLAMVDIVCAEKTPPILLDDPFVTFDDDRAGRAMSMLKQASPGRQTILFTYSDRYDGFADRIVNL